MTAVKAAAAGGGGVVVVVRPFSLRKRFYQKQSLRCCFYEIFAEEDGITTWAKTVNNLFII